MVRHTFRKAERLKSEKIIKELFKKGSSFYAYPLKLFYLPAEELPNSQILITVPKKKFKRAVDRNLIKRRIREAYRLNKHHIISDKVFYMAFVYIADKHEAYELIEAKLKNLIIRLGNT